MKKARDKVETGPSQHEQCSSGRSHSSSSGSAPGFLEETHLSSFQECILSFSEEEWEDFSSLLNTPMTRTQFSELCMAILKVVSLSSMTVIVPAYVFMAKDAGTPVSRTSTSTTFSLTSIERSLAGSVDTDGEFLDKSSTIRSGSAALPEMTSGPLREIMYRMKAALATLRRTHSSEVSETAVLRSVSKLSTHTGEHIVSNVSEAMRDAQHGNTFHDSTCINTILERLVSSGNIHKIAKNLVSHLQDVLQNENVSQTSIPVAASGSTSDSETLPKGTPKRTLSASHVIYFYAEEAIKDLLQPYFLPGMVQDASEDAASARVPLLRIQSFQSSDAGRSIPHVPSEAEYKFSDVANLFTRVMTFQVMDIVDSELEKRQKSSSSRLSDRSRMLSSAGRDVDDTAMERSSTRHPLLHTSQDHNGGRFSGFIERFLSELRVSDSAQSDAVDDVRATTSSTRSQSTKSATAGHEPDMALNYASQKLGDPLDLFTRVIVHQVMDILHVELARHQTEVGPIVQQQMSLGRTSTGTSVPDSSDCGCFVTVLMLRLLAKILDQQTASADMTDSSRELIQKVLSEFSSASGTPNFLTYESNTKIQTLYRSMDKFLLKEFGPEAILQRAVETQNVSFDNILLTALRKELLPHCDTEATSAPSTLTAEPLEPVPGAASGQTTRKRPKLRFSMKMPKRRSKKVAPTSAFSDSTGHLESPASRTPSNKATPVVSASGQKTRKCSFFIRMFACCIQGTSEP
ncbi:uncharacterized protein LOC125297166 isoform X3 [Alosa alosa]|uniref:uncharacterized protein LOC125297166 isoform X3 n=1 Tax=Alosa alosa TaxID=278164 RepID=UPI002015486F|nr:uncharacterized protein LOC125297166 isoform X3 [Alosa alosa]